jgi:hypothetical protein
MEHPTGHVIDLRTLDRRLLLEKIDAMEKRRQIMIESLTELERKLVRELALEWAARHIQENEPEPPKRTRSRSHSPPPVDPPSGRVRASRMKYGITKRT